MPEFPTLQPLSSEPLAIILLAPTGAYGAETWDECEAFWKNQLASLPAGSSLVPAHSGAMGEGKLLALALDRVTQPRVLVVPALSMYLRADLIQRLSVRLDQAHVVSLVRPEVSHGLAIRILRGTVGLLTRVLLALDLGPTPGWPGWRRWGERCMGWWCLGMRGRDPFAPCKMIRSTLVPSLALQSQGVLVHGEIVAKANFLGALLDEERLPINGTYSAEPPDPSWWCDFINLCNHPVFKATHENSVQAS